MSGRVKPLRIPEADYQARITNLAEMQGWRWWHIKDSRKQVGNRWLPDGECAGFPDLTLAHPQRGLVFAEVKGEGGKFTASQKIALPQLAAAVAVTAPKVLVQAWWPRDWEDVVVPVLMGTYDGPRFHGLP